DRNVTGVQTCALPILEVQVRFDFLMPEENPSSVEAAEHGQPKSDNLGACIPLKYLSDPRQRIDIYRKLAQTTDRQALTHLRAERSEERRVGKEGRSGR